MPSESDNRQVSLVDKTGTTGTPGTTDRLGTTEQLGTTDKLASPSPLGSVDTSYKLGAPNPLGSLGTITALFALTLIAFAFIAFMSAARTPLQESSTADLLSEACAATNPFLLTTRFTPALRDLPAPDTPAVIAFRGGVGVGEAAEKIVVATAGDVGAVYGLAYDGERDLVYASAYHKRGTAFGPAGPGGIYRIDTAGGTVETFATIEAGVDRHAPRDDDDAPAERWVGISGLGDIDLSEDGGTLFVANLFDAHINTLDTADGVTLARFRHGAAGERWSRDARLFALSVHESWLYHGVVDLRGSSTESLQPVAHIFRSRPDGSEMSKAAVIELNYRNRVGQQPWGAAEPMLTDIVIMPAGAMVLGLRDRGLDTGVVFAGTAIRAPAQGIVRALPDGDGWIRDDALAFDDALGVSASSGAIGGLALFEPIARIATTAFAQQLGGPVAGGSSGLDARTLGGALWFGADGERIFEWIVEDIAAGGGTPLIGAVGGDLELACALSEFDPGLPATATAGPAASGTARMAAMTATQAAFSTLVAATSTAIATVIGARPTEIAGTATALAATPAATATAVPAAKATRAAFNLGVIDRSCGTDNPYFITTCFIRIGTRTANQPAVVAFNQGGAHLVLATQDQVGTVYGLAVDDAQGVAFTSAFFKNDTAFGPGGPGAIYRIDMRTGAVGTWVTLPAGPDPRGWRDAEAWVGNVSLGDIELSEDGTELYAVNLFDQLIYRYSVPDGRLLGIMPQGGFFEPWSVDAKPFGLGVRKGRIYLGVVDSRESDGPDRIQEAVVYRMWPDGSGLEVVARFTLDYTPPGYTARRWNRWVGVAVGGRWGDRQPMLSDIAFRPDGAPIVALRDRWGDIFDGDSGPAGEGDILPALPIAGLWEVQTDPEHYFDRIIHDETTWGALAAFPGRDWVVTTAVDPIHTHSGGALWYDNVGGTIERAEEIYAGPLTTTFGKINGLGDVEPLCPDPNAPTRTPTATPGTEVPSATPSATPTRTLTPTATTTSTSTATATASPSPTPHIIYIPLTDKNTCRISRRYTDVVLVIDLSTSMERLTRDGRQKFEAALEAAQIFAELLDLSPDLAGRSDRLGLAGFNDTAWTERELTRDADAITAALARMPDRIAEGTRLDLAIAQGQATLDGAEDGPSESRVMILLTDGLPNRVPTPESGGRQEDTVIAEAARAKAVGTRIFTIGLGLGEDVLRDLLGAVASRPEDYHFAPDGEDLADVYRQIAGRIRGCG